MASEKKIHNIEKPIDLKKGKKKGHIPELRQREERKTKTAIFRASLVFHPCYLIK